MAPSIKFYTSPPSNNALRVELYLLEKGFQYESVNVDLLKGQHKEDDYLKVNPRGQIPAIADGDIFLNESVAIMQYLEHRYGDQGPAMYPKDPAKLALCYRFIHEYQAKVDHTNIFGSVFFRGQTRQDLGERIEKLKSEMALMDQNLQGKDYLCGPELTMADLVYFPLIYIYTLLGLSKEEFPNVLAWFHRMKARDAMKQVAIFEAHRPWREKLSETGGDSILSKF